MTFACSDVGGAAYLSMVLLVAVKAWLAVILAEMFLFDERRKTVARVDAT